METFPEHIKQQILSTGRYIYEDEYYTLRRGGGWYAEGQPKSYHSVFLAMGYRRTYLDPSF